MSYAAGRLIHDADSHLVEGGRNSLKRFDGTVTGCTPTQITNFYSENFIDLMGEGLAPHLRRPKLQQSA